MEKSAHLSYQYLPLHELMERLKKEGFSIGVNTLLDIKLVLATFDDETDRETIKLAICPLLAETSEQQAQFYRIFDELFADYSRKQTEFNPYGLEGIRAQHGILKHEKVIAKQKAIGRNEIRLVFLILFFTTGFGFWLGQDVFKPKTEFAEIKMHLESDSLLQTRDSLSSKIPNGRYCGTSDEEARKISKEEHKKLLWDKFVKEQETKKLKKERLEQEKYKNSEIKTPAYLRDFLSSQVEIATDSIWSIRQNPELLQQLSQTDFGFKEVEAPDVNDLKFTVNIPAWYNRVSLVRWWIFTFVLLSYLAYEAFLFRRKLKTLAREKAEAQADALPMNLDAYYHVEYPHDFAEMADKMRNEESYLLPQLNISKTVKSTASNGGILDLVYSEAEKPAKYLVLIDQSSRKNQQSLLFDFMSTVLVKHDIYVTKFYFNKDLRTLWSEEAHEKIDLNHLFTHYIDHKLVIFGTGEFLINFLGKNLKNWAEELLNWEERTLFTPKETGAWNWSEGLLKKLFRVLPATMEGMMEMAQNNEVVDTEVFQQIEEQKAFSIIDLEEEPLVVIENLKLYFQELTLEGEEKPEADVMTWLAGCCLYPQLFWDLTLFIGKELSTPNCNLLTTDNLTKLTSLKWFQEGAIPEGIRELLIFDEEIISAEQREKVAKAIAERVENALSNESNEAILSRERMYLLTLELLQNPTKPQKRKLLRELDENLKGTNYQDALATHFLKKSDSNLLDNWIPKGIKNALYNGQHAFTGFNWKGRIAVACALICLPFLLQEQRSSCEKAVSYRGENYCLETQSDSARFILSMAMSDYGNASASKNIDDRLMQKAISMRSDFKAKKVLVDYNMAVSHFEAKQYADVVAIAGYLLKLDATYSEGLDELYPLLAISYLNLGFEEGAVLNILRTKIAFNRRERLHIALKNFLTKSPQKTTLAKVEGGKFKMGSADGSYFERPVHEVTLSDFHLGTTEVTNSQYADFLNRTQKSLAEIGEWIDLGGVRDDTSRITFNAGFYQVQEGYENHPVTFVSWFGANAYAKAQGGRLPTEAEWEYASKGGKYAVGYRFSGSDEVEDVAWFKKNAKNAGIQPVATKYPNGLGIYDMSGNAWEWCNDWYSESIYHNDATNPKGWETGKEKVVRGGAWLYGERYVQNFKRYNNDPKVQFAVYGFRVAFD
jgi:formylglycine-generating enzyme required for sulfatase activity